MSNNVISYFCNSKNNMWGKVHPYVGQSAPQCGEKCTSYVGKSAPPMWGKVHPLCGTKYTPYVGQSAPLMWGKLHPIVNQNGSDCCI